MDALFQDLRYTLRSLRQRPLFTAVAVLSLALGIGANTAIFSLVNALLLRPLPGIENYERVVELGRGRRAPDGTVGFDTWSWPDFADVREQVPALDVAAAYRFEAMSLNRGGEGERVAGMFVTSAYFDALGIVPAMGRLLGAAEATGIGQHPVAVLNHGFWEARLGSDPDVVGSTIRLNRQPYTVIGVTAAEFDGHFVGYAADVMLPVVQFPAMNDGRDYFADRRINWHWALGRLAPGATLDELNAQLAALGGRLATAFPDTNRDRGFRAVALGPVPGAGRGLVTGFMGVLMAMVGVILLVTCANIGGMFLARALAREKEVALRLALGAARGRLVRQLLTEGLVVFVLGGVLGAAAAGWLVANLPLDRLPVPIPLDFDFAPDGRVFLFALGVTVVTGLAFGLLPALQATRLDLVGSLKDEGAGGRGGRRLRRAFVTGQVGLSLVLLVTAALFLRSLQHAGAARTAFDPSGVFMTGVDLSLEGYEDEAAARAFQRTLLQHVRAVPGVASAALAIDLPLDMGAKGFNVIVPGVAGEDGEGRVGVDFNVVSTGYFETLSMPVLLGRGFTAGDGVDAEDVAVVSRAFVERVWPTGSPLGRELSFDGRRHTVVGIVADVKNQAITDPAEPFVYLALAQHYRAAASVVAKATGGIDAVAPALRGAILEADPSLSLTPVIALERYTRLGTLPQRVAAGLTTGLGLLALLLSGLGVYGVLAYAVARRTREIGVRMALGARRRRVTGMILRSGLGLALPGLAGGALLAALVARVLQGQGMLLGVSAADPLALAGVALALATVVALASVVPARRAASVAPAEALRSE